MTAFVADRRKVIKLKAPASHPKEVERCPRRVVGVCVESVFRIQAPPAILTKVVRLSSGLDSSSAAVVAVDRMSAELVPSVVAVPAPAVAAALFCLLRVLEAATSAAAC